VDTTKKNISEMKKMDLLRVKPMRRWIIEHPSGSPKGTAELVMLFEEPEVWVEQQQHSEQHSATLHFLGVEEASFT
jgi:hypothetical protein